MALRVSGPCLLPMLDVQTTAIPAYKALCEAYLTCLERAFQGVGQQPMATASWNSTPLAMEHGPVFGGPCERELQGPFTH